MTGDKKMGIMTIVDRLLRWLLTLILGESFSKSPLGLAIIRAGNLMVYSGIALVLATLIDVFSDMELINSYPFLAGVIVVLGFLVKLFKELETPPK